MCPSAHTTCPPGWDDKQVPHLKAVISTAVGLTYWHSMVFKTA